MQMCNERLKLHVFESVGRHTGQFSAVADVAGGGFAILAAVVLGGICCHG